MYTCLYVILHLIRDIINACITAIIGHASYYDVMFKLPAARDYEIRNYSISFSILTPKLY